MNRKWIDLNDLESKVGWPWYIETVHFCFELRLRVFDNIVIDHWIQDEIIASLS